MSIVDFARIYNIIYYRFLQNLLNVAWGYYLLVLVNRPFFSLEIVECIYENKNRGRFSHSVLALACLLCWWAVKLSKKNEKKNAGGNASCKLMRWLQDFSGLLPTLKEHKPVRREELYNLYHLL